MAFRSYELSAMRWLSAETTRRPLGVGRGRRVVRRRLLGSEVADKGPLWALRVMAWGLARRIADGGCRMAEGRLFLGERGPLTAAGVWTIVRKYGRRAGIEGLRVHQFRHTALRRMLDDGVDLATAATIAGHSDLRTTLRYTRPSKAGLEAAVRKLEMGGGDA